MLLIDLNGKWEMKNHSKNSAWLPAVVPGSVYSDLLNNNMMEDPFWRENEKKCFELSRFDYEYKRCFYIEEKVLESDFVVLKCLGLDTLSEIYINGKLLAKTNNMHRRYEFDLKEFLAQGENEINVIFRSPVEYCEGMDDKKKLEGHSCAVRGSSYIRKGYSMLGWDWGPMLPDMGIWRDINIIYGNKGRIDDFYLRQKHSKNKVNIDFELENILIDENCSAQNIITVTDEDGNSYTAKSSDKKASLTINNPKLWWPCGYGEQSLYNVNNKLYIDGELVDEKNSTIGLRTLIVNADYDEIGRKFQVEVNGTPIFVKGADYIIEDNIFSRCNRERTETLIRDCVKSNFNTIRVWGGGIYPHECFYDLCDKYGIVVWQDFMFANATYLRKKEFLDNVTEEIKDNVKRLRNRASLLLWCGNNEIEESWVGKWKNKPICTPALKKNYVDLFEGLIPSIVAKYDPQRFYWPSSPSAGGNFTNTSSQDYGDMHYWGVWFDRAPFTDFRKYFPRMMSEFGLQSFPDYKTIKSFTLPEDRNIFSHVMESHQKSPSGNEIIFSYISMIYKYPKNFESLIYLSQLIQAEGIKYGVEHWRRNRGRCMGTMYWQLNDCWPVASWSSIDSFGRWKALQYAARKFYAPIMISACEEKTSADLWIANETMNKVNGKVVWALKNNLSTTVFSGEKEISVNALTSKKAINLDFTEYLSDIDNLRSSVLEYSFVIDGKVVSDGTVAFEKYKHFNFVEPKLTADVFTLNGVTKIKLSAENFAKFVCVDLKDADMWLSDNYFDITGGSTKIIEIERLSEKLSIDEIKQQLVVKSLFNSYE